MYRHFQTEVPHDQSDAATACAVRHARRALLAALADPHGRGLGQAAPSLWAEPKKSFQPFVWSYAQAKGALDAAGRLINTELAERRNLILQNPAEGYATSRTIVAAYQMIMPGEKARSHRHTPNALRLDRRRRARRLHHRQRRAAFDDAGRRGADAELVLARPRQRQPRLRLLARRARRAAGASARADVLRAASRRLREREHRPERLADAFPVGGDQGAADGGGSARRRQAAPRSRWRCRARHHGAVDDRAEARQSTRAAQGDGQQRVRRGAGRGHHRGRRHEACTGTAAMSSLCRLGASMSITATSARCCSASPTSR